MEDLIDTRVKKNTFSTEQPSPPKPQSLKKRISKNVLHALSRQLQESTLNLEEEDKTKQVSDSIKRALRDQLEESSSSSRDVDSEDEMRRLQTHHSRTESMDSATILETQQTNSTSVYINDRVIHATGVQGSYVSSLLRTVLHNTYNE